MKNIRNRAIVISLSIIMALMTAAPYQEALFSVFAEDEIEQEIEETPEYTASASEDATTTILDTETSTESADIYNEATPEDDVNDAKESEPADTIVNESSAVEDEKSDSQEVQNRELPKAQLKAAPSLRASQFPFTVKIGTNTSQRSTWRDVMTAIQNANGAVVITMTDDYTFTQEDQDLAFPATREFTLDGGGFTLTRGDDVTGDLITVISPTKAVTIQNVVIDNNTNVDAAGSVIKRVISNNMALLKIDRVTIRGGKTSGNLIQIDNSVSNGRGVQADISNCTIELEESTGRAIAVSSNTTNIENGLRVISSTIVGARDNTSSPLIDNDGNTNLSILNSSTLYRGQTIGSAIVNGGSGTMTITDSTISGAKSETDSSSISASEPLIRQGSGSLTMTGAVVSNHKAGTAGICAVEASSASAINITGSTTITGNTASGSPANLDIGTKLISIPRSHTGKVGITSADHYHDGDKFSNGIGAAYKSGSFVNDKEESLKDARIDNALYWINDDVVVKNGTKYLYKGIIYTVDGTKATATGMYRNDAEIVSEFSYNTQTFKVVKVNAFNPEGTHLALEDALVERMYPRDITVHDFVPVCPDEENLNGSSIAGDSNSSVDYEMWKSAHYDESTNSVEVTLDYFQKLKAAPIDFIIIADESASTYDLRKSGDISNAPIALWERAAMRKMAKALLSANETKHYDNRIAFVVSGEQSGSIDTAYASKFFDEYDQSVVDWVSGNYLNSGGVTCYAAGQSEVLRLTNESQSADPKRKTVVIYMTDFHQYTEVDETARDAIQTKADVYAVSMFGYRPTVIGEKRNIQKVAGSNAKMYYVKEDPGQIADILTNITEDAIGYYIEDTFVADDLSVPLAALTANASVSGKNGGTSVSGEQSGLTWTFPSGDTVSISEGTIKWQFPERDEESDSETRMTSGIHYSRTIRIPIGDSNVFTGAVPTNGDCLVKKDNKDVNKIDADDFPVLRKPLTLVKVDSNDSSIKLSDVEFTLKRDGKQWDLRTDSNGAIILPWGNDDTVGETTANSTFRFKPNDEYILTETAADEDYYLPGGHWKIKVGSDYKISAESMNADAHTKSITKSGGKLVIGNEHRATVTLTYKPEGGEFSDHTTTDKVENHLDGDVCTVMEQKPTWTNHKFAGWKLNDSTIYEPGDNFTITENTILTAQWIESGDITISNKNTGDYSNKDDSFTVAVTLAPGEGQDALTGEDDPRLELITGIDEWKIEDGKVTANISVDGTTNGNSARKIANIPMGWVYTVKEIEPYNKYSVKYSDNDITYAESEMGKTGTLQADTTVYIWNERQNVVSSGIAQGPKIMMIFAWLILATVLARLIFLIRRRKAMTRG